MQPKEETKEESMLLFKTLIKNATLTIDFLNNGHSNLGLENLG